MNEEIEQQYFPREQMVLWGNVNMVIGATAITAVHFIVLLLGTAPLDAFWQGLLLLVLGSVSYICYRQYRRTKEREEE